VKGVVRPPNTELNAVVILPRLICALSFIVAEVPILTDWPPGATLLYARPVRPIDIAFPVAGKTPIIYS
jgi:hypothetical protein